MATTSAGSSALPKPRPFVGHFPVYGRDPLGFVTRLSREVGGVVPIRMGPFPALVITDPAAIEEVLITKNKDFRKSLATRRIGVVTGNGILVSEGETWREHRRAVQPAFHRERIEGWATVMTHEADVIAKRWQDGQTLDMHREMTELTLRIVVRTLLASDVTEQDIETVARAAAELTHHFDSRFNGLSFFIPDFVPTPNNLRMRRTVKRLDTIIYRLIAQRRATSGGDDIISMLLAARNDSGKPLTDREIRDEVMTLFLAGHETTALTLTWALYALARNPDAQSRLQAELEETLGDRVPTVNDIPNLRYTDAVINETLRLYPSAYAVSREAIRPTTIAGQPVSKRSLALVSIYAAHRNPERFENADEFRPERWLDGLARRLPKGAFIPFAEGPRKCIGSAFAMQEAVLVLATLASRVRVAQQSDREIGAIAAVTLRPAEPVRLRLTAMSAV
jgi:cytochrome P450